MPARIRLNRMVSERYLQSSEDMAKVHGKSEVDSARTAEIGAALAHSCFHPYVLRLPIFGEVGKSLTSIKEACFE